MRRSFIVLSVGAALLVVGFVMNIATAVTIIQDAEQNAFFEALIDVGPLARESTTFRISDTSQPFYILVTRVGENQLTPPTVRVEGRVQDPNGDTITTDTDIDQGFTKVVPTVAGTYQLHLTNTNTDNGARLLITMTHGSVPTTVEEALTTAGFAVAGVVIMMIGGLVIVVGAILLYGEWRNSKRGSSILT